MLRAASLVPAHQRNCAAVAYACSRPAKKLTSYAMATYVMKTPSLPVVIEVGIRDLHDTLEF